MKKYLLYLSCFVLVVMLVMSSSSDAIQPASAPQPALVTPAFAEMAASKLKETLVEMIKTSSTSSDKFYLQHGAYAQPLQACLLMATKDHAAARTLLTQQGSLSVAQLKTLREHTATQETMKQLELLEGQSYKLVADKIVTLVNPLDVTPLNVHAYKKAGYGTYYADKKEDFSLSKQDAWEDKQKNVLAILQEYKPQQVLDLGGNSGWFSRLAATYGAHVIATDIDELSIEYQYQAAQHAGLSVTPMVHSFQLLSNPEECERLKSEMVFCLALIHHLVIFGEMTLEDIIDRLAKVTNKVLVLEFVDLNDEAIQNGFASKAFFSNKLIEMKARNILINYCYKYYNLKNIMDICLSNFSSVKVLKSTPAESRYLLILKK